MIGVQVFKNEFYIHIHLNKIKIKFQIWIQIINNNMFFLITVNMI